MLLLVLSGCSDNPFEASEQSAGTKDSSNSQKLRHPQLAAVSANSFAGKGGESKSEHVFIGLNQYEEDGVTRRVLDTYGVTRRILQEYGVTRRVLEQYGVTRRVMEEYGISHEVLGSFSFLLDQLDPLGVQASRLNSVDYDITRSFLNQEGVSNEQLDERGVTDAVIEQYGVTRRVLEQYGLSVAEYLKVIADWERTIRLKARIDSARPGLFVSLGQLPLSDFLEEAGADHDIDVVEIDVEMDSEQMGTITASGNGAELTPWGISDIGGAQGDGGSTRVYLLDSGVETADLNVAQRLDFSYMFKDRDTETWDDSEEVNRPLLDLRFVDLDGLLPTIGSTLGGLLGGDTTQHRDDASGDRTGHGTHMAGIIGAESNGTLVVGAAPGVAIHSLRVMTEQGHTDIATVVAALDHIAMVRRSTSMTTRFVVNMSLGMRLGSTEYNVLDEAVANLAKMGVVVVVSAGNDGSDASLYSPAHVTEAITVGSYNQDGRLSSFSNHGRVVDVLAPGEFIVSLSWAPGDSDRNVGLVESGTSQAAAHVSGLIAEYLHRNPLSRTEDIISALLSGGRSISDVPRTTVDTGVFLESQEGGILSDGLTGLLGGGSRGGGRR